MRISTKLGLVLTLTSASILGSYGYGQFRREEADLKSSAEHEARLLGVALQVAVENALRDGQAADVREMLESLEVKDPGVDLFVFNAQGKLVVHSWGGIKTLPLIESDVHPLTGAPRSVTRFHGPEGLSHLSFVFHLRDDDGSPLGALALVKPLDALREDLKTTRRDVLLSVLTLIVGSSLVGWMLVVLYIQRPLGRLVGAMRSVVAGDFTANVVPHQRDEVGEVVLAFNAMVKELGAARNQLTAEVEARIALEAGLRRVDKLATIGQLSAGLAHEIGSPLLILGGRAQALAARTELPEDVRRNANILVEQVERISRIVQQLLDFSRRKPLRLEEMDILVSVRAVVDLLELEARKRNVRLEFSCPRPLPRVLADGDGVQQVALNLLTNALRATPQGGEVRVSLTPSAFQRAGTSERQAVCLSVEDTGPGMSEDSMKHVFEPFFSTWSSSGGTGLGLAVVKAIMTEHGGAVSVVSPEGKGGQFFVHFPVAPVDAVVEVVA
ncbi:sensor histidine kinase [Myxococcus stipitatus]|uniref:sensor histidine kinase n=1 Tax=Myxococcus stipitatus TaxID=83455 RepID=UPI0030CAF321